MSATFTAGTGAVGYSMSGGNVDTALQFAMFGEMAGGLVAGATVKCFVSGTLVLVPDDKLVNFGAGSNLVAQMIPGSGAVLESNLDLLCWKTVLGLGLVVAGGAALMRRNDNGVRNAEQQGSCESLVDDFFGNDALADFLNEIFPTPARKRRLERAFYIKNINRPNVRDRVHVYSYHCQHSGAVAMKYFTVHSNPSYGRWLWFFTFCIAGLLVLFWNDGPAESRVNSAADTSFVSSSSEHKPTESLTRGKFREIQDLRVGDRVLAENPEVSAEERAAYVEPDWRRWLQISLQMPKADGSVLEMELLRPDEWLIEQATLLVDEPVIEYVRADLLTESDAEVEEVRSGYGPVRPAFADLGWRLELAEACGLVASGFVVQMDLPELGLTGEAVVVEVQPAPVVKAGTGRVVTATFKHSSGDVIDLVVAGDGSQETLGTTSNHPFWSVDRQDYVQAGKLELGERLQTYSGDTKRVVSKLARPGPEPVFNLEVHAEHVYYVGQQGLLVHNSDQYAPNSAATTGHLSKKVMSEAEVAYRAARSRARFEASAHTITLRHVEGMPRQQFMRKAQALQELGEQGRLIRRTTPRDPVVTRAYRQDTINRIWAQYGQRNPEFANKLIDRVTRRMSPDHVHELQLLGPDAASNLRWLDRFTNENIGMQQIWPQIRSLPQGTPIRVRVE